LSVLELLLAKVGDAVEPLRVVGTGCTKVDKYEDDAVVCFNVDCILKTKQH